MNIIKIKPLLPASSGALVFFRGKILLIKRDNKPNIPHPDMWSIPGGQVEKGESFDEALKRELQEEIGIIPKRYKLLGFLKVKTDKVKRAIYLIKISREEFKKAKLGNEGQEMKWFRPDEIKDLNAVPQVRDFFRKNAGVLSMLIKDCTKIEELKNSLKTKIRKDTEFVLFDFKNNSNSLGNNS
ncbi:MAG: Nudix hydrolase family protein [Candidatus Woesebacteria bacterium]|jgi:8-oxo-dGTP diphosphatase|nr:MAG: Nudix hydrolase family protein [Candidatus Woesebacteria bacterium]